MKIVNHSVEFIEIYSTYSPIVAVEQIAKTCYQSESCPHFEDKEEFVRKLIRKGHTAMLEFADIYFRIITDRGVSHELVRHRMASYAQESTRYCNYKDKDIEFIEPISLANYKNRSEYNSYKTWYSAMIKAEEAYQSLLAYGCSPQIARSVLPNSLKTEICVKFNMRSFRNFIQLRTAKDAHPDMQHVANLCVDAIRDTDYFIFIEDLVE